MLHCLYNTNKNVIQADISYDNIKDAVYNLTSLHTALEVYVKFYTTILIDHYITNALEVFQFTFLPSELLKIHRTRKFS